MTHTHRERRVVPLWVFLNHILHDPLSKDNDNMRFMHVPLLLTGRHGAFLLDHHTETTPEVVSVFATLG